MARTYNEIPKRAKNSITAHLKKLTSKYGVRDVRLVCNKFFEKISTKIKLEEEIASRENELQILKRKQ